MSFQLQRLLPKTVEIPDKLIKGCWFKGNKLCAGGVLRVHDSDCVFSRAFAKIVDTNESLKDEEARSDALKQRLESLRFTVTVLPWKDFAQKYSRRIKHLKEELAASE